MRTVLRGNLIALIHLQPPSLHTTGSSTFLFAAEVTNMSVTFKLLRTLQIGSSQTTQQHI